MKEIKETDLEKAQIQLQSRVLKKELEEYRDENHKLVKYTEDLSSSLKNIVKEYKYEYLLLVEQSDRVTFDNQRLTEKLNNRLHEISELHVLLENTTVASQSFQNTSTIRIKKIAKLQQNQRELISKIKTLQSKNGNKENRIIQKEKAILQLQTSSSIRIGQTFVQALSQPGKKTIFFPYYFLKAVFEAAFVHER